ncbi:hypothetical protein [Larkinella rosea]|uniref:Uncharacterized protein n=1 Tax=Larkinella rosea TaxID=2025312 RepID=A0A3P1BH94_9BACT|nr:hypothetical protein [Larkinella rosea]RRA99973.1 hypothetical protein EHT25_25430 [Larkinella rosea]
MKNEQVINRRIPSVLLLFWALYLSLVLVSNTADALKALGILSSDAVFVSGNFDLIQKVVSIYHSPGWLAGLLYAGVLGWQTAGSILLWQAFVADMRQKPGHKTAAVRALTALIGLWAAFLLSDEFFLAYEMPGLSNTHFNLLIASIATAIAVRMDN